MSRKSDNALSKPNNINYRGPGGRDIGRPLPWPAFLALAAKGASAASVKEWYEGLRDNERVDVRAGIKQIMELSAYCVSIDAYALTGATASFQDIERDLDRLGVSRLHVASGVNVPQEALALPRGPRYGRSGGQRGR